VDAGQLNDKYRGLKCEFKFPAFDIRDILKDAQAYQILLANNLVSKSTVTAHFGYDFREEMEQTITDGDIEFSPTGFNPPDAFPGGNPSGGDGDEPEGDEGEEDE
jgi:hypothetical protein